MRVLGVIFYIGLGFIQLSAVMDALEAWLGLPGFIAAILGFLLAYFPLVGSIVGVFGAMDVWGCAWGQAGPLFFGGLVFALGLAGLSTVASMIAERKYRAS